MCKDCMHKDVCKYKEECSKVFDKLQEVPMEHLSPIKAKVECLHYQKQQNIEDEINKNYPYILQQTQPKPYSTVCYGCVPYTLK